MWSTIGLAINALGAGLVLIPDVPLFWNRMNYLPPFRRIEEGKEELFLNGMLQPDDPGFSRISEAILEGSRPLRSGERMDQKTGNAVSLDIAGDSLEIEEDGFEIVSIEREDDKTLATAIFSVVYAHKSGLALEGFLAEHDMESPGVPIISSETPPGRLPDWIEEYEKRVVSRVGMALLLLGFLVQAFAQLGILS